MRKLLFVLALAMLPSRFAHAAPHFKHIILIIQENRTVDNLFGSNPTFEPGVDIATSGVTSKGKVIPLQPEPLTSCYDPAHSHTAFEGEWTIGFDIEEYSVHAGCTVPADAAYGYVDNSAGQVQPYFDIAEAYGFANRMFQTNEGTSYIAHQFLFSGTSAPKTDSALMMDNSGDISGGGVGCAALKAQRVKVLGPDGKIDGPPVFPCINHPTMSDVLEANGVTWRYYTPKMGGAWSGPDSIKHICGPVPYNSEHDACEGADYAAHMSLGNPAQVLTDIANCDLQNVTWVIPTAQDSDHAGSNDGSGPAWVASIINAIGDQTTCPGGEDFWKDTAIFVTWDDWGGFYDHVAPFNVRLATSVHDLKWGDGETYGFRVPLLVVSAYTPAGYVDNGTQDFGSLLYFIEQNFGLGFIGPGTSTFTKYADYQAAVRGASLKGFFTRSTPRPFIQIPSPLPPSYFIDMKNANIGPDND